MSKERTYGLTLAGHQKKNQQIGQNLQNEKLMLFKSNVGFQDQVTSYSFESKNL